LAAEHQEEANILLSRGGRLESKAGVLSSASLDLLRGLSWTKVSLLLDFGALSRTSYSMLLVLAATDGQSFVVERLLQEKADVNAEPARYDGRTALQAAAEGGHLEIVKLLESGGTGASGRDRRAP
jgi:hypothetical protein